MGTFSTLAFEDQRARIAALVASGDDPVPLLREAASLPDVEPLACLLDALAERGRLHAAPEDELGSLVGRLEDAALQHLFSRSSPVALEPVLERLAERALGEWPIERISALAFLARWLRRRAPEAHARVLARAEEALEREPREGRLLLFASGARLAALACDPRAAPWVHATTERAIDALARAPKSISQAHAERLLAQRVYADPGHFFFELLQNADDAGATRWSVSIERDRVVARHDGAPFSLLDLVGVLSIGQTTKRADQIGFFGVGFKSVYEICERPRIHSGALDVEIAHISIPRALGPRSGESVPNETSLVLPYAGAVDALALHRRALAIPPETLLWLAHLRALEVRGPDAARQAWREEREGEAWVLRRAESTQSRRYRMREREVSFPGAREPGRARTSRVAVAVALDDTGAPRPVQGPTLYAFLPTAERTGLGTMVHARFDVTLDRERLELGSAWNDALLEAAGDALAELLAELAAEGTAVLPVIPSGGPDGELAPAMAPLARALRGRLRDVACLPDAAGGSIAPARACLLEPALALALAGVDLGGGVRSLAPLTGREREVAAWLGARAFGEAELARWIATVCAPGEPPPPWLGSAVLGALARAPTSDAALRELAILADATGRLVRASDALAAPPRWARLYAGERPVISSEALDALPAALRARLAIPALDVPTLCADLHDGARCARLLAKGDALFEVLAELEDEVLAQLADVPLLPRAGRDERLPRGAGVVRLDDALAPLAAALAPRLPLLDPAFEARHPALARRWVPALDLEALAAALEAGLALDEGALDALERILDRAAPQLPRPLARRLGALPLFADRHGERRALLGPRRALTPEHAANELPALLPRWPWLERAERPFVEAVDPPRLDARELAGALAGTTRDLPTLAPVELAPAEAWLGARAGELPGALIDALARAAIWLDREGTPRPLDALRRGTPSEALDALYAATGARRVASKEALAFARALGLDPRLPVSDHAALVADLVREGVPASAPRDALAAALVEASEALTDAALAPIARVAVFEDEHGVLRPLAGWSAPDERAAHRPGEHREVLRAGPWPLLSAAAEARYAPLLARLAVPAAGPLDVVRHAPALAGDPAALIAFLDQHHGALDEAARSALAALPIFRSRDGARRPARELALAAPLERALGAARLDALGLEDALFHPGDEARALRWQLASRSTAELLEARVLPALSSGAPLASQPAPWAARDALAALAELASASGLDPLGAPLALDARERVVEGPLWAASDAARRLAAPLELASRLADPEWAAALSPGSPLVAPLPARRIADALRAACPEEGPRVDHPILRDAAALYEWLRESARELERDGPARDALAAAAVLPSQRGTLRAPRDLVLDPSLPELGLGWGLAPDVPGDVARWLRATFELDRRARRALVSHVLDGLDAARAADDRARASQLLAFLARALGAGDVSAAELEERARRLEVRARLRVPLAGGGWDKPRFAWAPSDEAAVRAAAFALDLPPRIELPELDGPAALLLAACGAEDELDDAMVIAALEGRGLREGGAARRALARYVVLRALEGPARIERWGLGSRAWLPSAGGALRRPRELVWPDALARALLGERDPLLPDPEVVFDLDESAAARLGLRRAHELSLPEIAPRAVGREAHPVLIAWLERGLREGRLSPAEVRASFAASEGDVVLLRDDEGTLRAPRELALAGARELFGRWRGDLASGSDHPRLAHALGIPRSPDLAMIQAFLVEIGGALPALTEADRDALAQRLPECLARAAELARPGDRLPAGAALAAQRGGRVVLVRIGDPELALRAPEDDPASADPLPLDRSPELEALLLASGVPDRAPAPERRPEVAAWLEQGQPRARPELAPSVAPGDDGLVARLRRWLGTSERDEARPAPSPARRSAPARDRGERFFQPDAEIRSQLEQDGGWLESRREVPQLGFAFSPPRLEAPWLYAPKLVASRFDRAGQRWTAAHLPRPEPRGDAGLVVMRGRLPAGESVLPVPLYGRVVEVRAMGVDAQPIRGASGATALHLDRPAEVRLRVSLGRLPDLDPAREARGVPEALASFVPDDELPDEALAAVADLDPSAPAIARALSIRDFVRERYRYDPSYLEDPSVARFLARIGQGRAHAHVAALHAGRDGSHLGAGVCFELNSLACELLRRAGIPALLATGWVLDGGALSEPDHLWAIALLEDDAGAPLWAPIDASTTRRGRPLRVPRRPPIAMRAPRDPDARAPAAPRWDLGGASRERSAGGGAARGPGKRKKARAPEIELRRVLHHLAQLTGRALDEDERAALERALSDRAAAAELLDRLRGR